MAAVPPPPITNLYVKNVPHGTTQERLKEFCSQFGTVASVKLISNVPQPYAFVKYSNIDEAGDALRHLNGATLGDRSLDVSFALQEPLAKEQKILQEVQSGNNKLYVARLPENSTEQYVRNLFSAYGALTEVVILPGNGSAIVVFSKPEEAAKALQELDYKQPGGHHQPLYVRFKTNDTKQPSLRNQQQPRFAHTLPPVPLHHPTMSVVGHTSGGHIAGGDPTSIFVKHIPQHVDKVFLYENFARFGPVNSVRVLTDEKTKQCTGLGFVNFGDAHSAHRAVNTMNGQLAYSDGKPYGPLVVGLQFAKR